MKIPMIQQTVARTICCSGVGLHSGKFVNLKIKPAPVNHGIKFVRVDLPDKQVIPARFNCVVDTSLATVIGLNGAIVSTIEHLMASLAGLSIDNALIELDDYEVPVMDGSAGPFAKIILDAGITPQPAPRHFFVLKEPIELKDNGKFVGAYPDSTFRITCNIDFDHPVIRKQTCSIEVLENQFACEVSKARTFGFLQEVEQLIRDGFARGGSLENAVVLDKKNVLNTDGLRYEDEFVRHKLVDCIGDFSLLGMPILAHIMTKKSGHAFNHAFLKKFFAQKKSWEIKSLPDTDGLPPN
jgi:UDP-3-O-[3-hydroxymyristoyl] N-acetylglucosamine deacetylase